MGNLFRLNPLFEFELGAYPEKFNPNPTILQKAKSMEYLSFILSKQRDFVLLSEEIDPYFEKYLKKKFRGMGEYLSRDEILCQDSNLVEWGRFHSIDQDGTIQNDIEKIKTSRLLNSKISQLKIYKTEDNLHSRILEKNSEIQNLNFPILYKPDLSFSGIYHKILQTKEELFEFQKNLQKNGVVQEYKNRVLDFSFLYEIENNSINLLCITKMQINDKNTYISSSINSENSLKNITEKYKIDFTQINKKIKNLVQSFLSEIQLEYKGPLSVDGFIYKEKDHFFVREISEINFRYTMGRILYEVSKFFSENKEHTLLTLSLKDYKNSREDSLLELEERIKVQLENISKREYKECFLLTPPFLGRKLVSSCVVYYGT
jgi:hypothetical protein